MLKARVNVELSATDLVGHLYCRHFTQLNLSALEGSTRAPFFYDPLLELLWKRGTLHERAYIEQLRSAGYDIVQIEGAGVAASQVEETLAAMQRGVQIVVQGALKQGVWSGRADILRRVDTPSNLGAWSYEIIDTKLARETTAGTVLQLCLYADLLAGMQGVMPEHVYVVTPGSEQQPLQFRVNAYAAYYRFSSRIRSRTSTAMFAAGGWSAICDADKTIIYAS